MARIRSIHPGLWTDEKFVSLSPMARLLIMGIWNECDDQGVFAWSPLTLKMRILPADNVEVEDLLKEMTDLGMVLQYSIRDKSYGAIRNFCKFQRPKKPNAVHPTTDQVAEWTGGKQTKTEPQQEDVENQLPTGGEIEPQREDGGDKGSAPLNPPDKRGEEITAVQDAWNAMAVRSGLDPASRMTDKRRKAITARLAEHSLSDILDGIRMVPAEPHWVGKTHASWRGKLDNFLRPQHCAAFIEAADARKPREATLTPEELERRAQLWDKIDKPEDAARCRREAAKLREAA